jgi:signal transduction histidine kinase
MKGTPVPGVEDRPAPLAGAHPRRGRGSWLLPALIALVVAAAVVAQSVTDDPDVVDVCYLGVLIGASIAGWIGAGRWPPRQRLVWRLIAAGVTLNAVGEVLWTVLVRTGADPDVSVADLAWFTSYVLLCAAMWIILSRSRKDGRADIDFVVDALTIAVVSVLVFWRFTVESIVGDTTASAFARAVWVSYPLLDAVLLALVVRALLSRSGRAALGAAFGVGVCLWLAADILYLQGTEQRAATTAMNAAWLLAPVLMAWATWPGSRDRTAAVPAPAPSASKDWLLLLLVAVCPLIVPPALELVADLRGERDQPGQLVVGMAAVIVLALVRTGRVIRSEQRAQQELEVARDAALAASEAKSMFMANMSHELRTPLTTVLVATELLKESSVDAAQLDLLAKVRRSGERLQALVEGVLDFSRIEAGRAVLHPVEFDLHGLVADVADVHLPQARRQQTQLDWTIAPGVPRTVVGDQTRVFQVLNNLVENAVKFSANGRVRIDVHPAGDDNGRPAPGVRFTVSDTGIGIGEEDQERVFESFTQVDGSASRRYEGTGLGLAICKELTELMGGTITLRSRLGEGSTFTVRLPLAPPRVAVPEGEPLGAPST